MISEARRMSLRKQIDLELGVEDAIRDQVPLDFVLVAMPGNKGSTGVTIRAKTLVEAEKLSASVECTGSLLHYTLSSNINTVAYGVQVHTFNEFENAFEVIRDHGDRYFPVKKSNDLRGVMRARVFRYHGPGCR